MELLAWHNLFFVCAAGVAFAVLLIMAVFSLGHEFGGTHAADVHAHLGHLGEHDLGHAHDHEFDNSFARALSLLGIGRAPLSIVLFVFLICFGTIGLMSNMVFSSIRLPVSFFFLVSLACAGIGSAVVTRWLAGVVGKYLPTLESDTTKRLDLVGRPGKAVFPISETQGPVHVYDARGSLHQVGARTAQGNIGAEREVVLEDYVPDGDYYLVSDISTLKPV